MPSLLGMSSKEVKRQWSLESIIGSLHMKCIRPGATQRKRSDSTSKRDSQSAVDSRSPSSSCQRFGESSQAQPLPLPGSLSTILFRTDSGNSAPAEPSIDRGSKISTFQALPNPGHVKVGIRVVGEGDLVTASNSGDSSPETDDPSDSRLLSPQTSDYEIGTKSETSPSGLKQPPFAIQKISRDKSSPANMLSTYQAKPASPNQRPGCSKVPHLQNPCQGTLLSSPQSSILSPSRSPMRGFEHETATNSDFMLRKPYADSSLVGSGHCSSPGFGYNSGHNSITGDMQCQYLWPHSRCSPDCSPLPSPRMTSPGPSSRVHSGAVTPLHPHAGIPSAESPITWPDDVRQQSHRLPLPPLAITPFSPSYSAGTSPRVQRCPGRTENLPSPGSRWKKGRLLGRGTFGHVYLGFDRRLCPLQRNFVLVDNLRLQDQILSPLEIWNSCESGEMCAMKEVTLFSDDAKSKESAQQLEQEIVFLSQLCHHNIVQYYGSEMVDDKLYIYLEYVSGGSINKILQEYGQLGEAAIRSYTQQILSGLAYLHAQNTVHRDIKGANILVDPNGRVKLADFGMAEHINGQSAPLTFKGSPYWMAPEAIKNSGGSNLAVDIWSLGCTVIEMATTKPPWSQYEWVAAMFKIGNGKELPAIPDLLSEEGKDFVRQCLQRNPHTRPTAAQLLEHPFVKNCTTLERPILSVEPIESIGHAYSVIEMASGKSRICSSFDSSAAPVRCKCPKSSASSSDGLAGNISPPISSMRSSLSHSRSPRSGRLTPSPISSPRTTSGASTPRSGVSTGTTYSLYHPMTTNYLHEGIPNSHKTFHQDGYGYQEQKPDIFRGIVHAHLSTQPVSREKDVIRNKAEQTSSWGKRGQLYEAHLVLTDRVSQQLLRNPVRPKPRLEPNRTSPRPTQRIGI